MWIYVMCAAEARNICGTVRSTHGACSAPAWSYKILLFGFFIINKCQFVAHSHSITFKFQINFVPQKVFEKTETNSFETRRGKRIE